MTQLIIAAQIKTCCTLDEESHHCLNVFSVNRRRLLSCTPTVWECAGLSSCGHLCHPACTDLLVAEDMKCCFLSCHLCISARFHATVWERERGCVGDLMVSMRLPCFQMLLNLFCTRHIWPVIHPRLFVYHKPLNWTQRIVHWGHICWQSLITRRLPAVHYWHHNAEAHAQTSRFMLPHSVLSLEPASYGLIRRRISGIESAPAAAAVCGCWVEPWKLL